MLLAQVIIVPIFWNSRVYEKEEVLEAAQQACIASDSRQKRVPSHRTFLPIHRNTLAVAMFGVRPQILRMFQASM